MIMWNKFDMTVNLNELFSPVALASQVLFKLLLFFDHVSDFCHSGIVLKL